MDFFERTASLIAAVFTAIFGMFMYSKRNLDKNIEDLKEDVVTLRVSSSALSVSVENLHEDVKEIKELLQKTKRR